MASFDLEFRFVARFWEAAEKGTQDAWATLDVVRPGMLESRELDERFGKMSGRFAAGEPVDCPDDPRDQLYHDLAEEASTGKDVLFFARRVRDDWRAREQFRLLQLAVIEADRAIVADHGTGNGKAKKVADRLVTVLSDLFSDSGTSGQLSNISDILDDQLAAMDRPSAGVAVPYAKLNEDCGPWAPGDVIGLPAFSGGGKSTLAANLARRFARNGVPVIAFPTEMREQWVARLLAADSGVPQMIAEKMQWPRASADQREAYTAAVERLRTYPIEIVNRANITPHEIVAATRILRRRWTGQTVVVIVDHMHRLNYGAEESNKGVGPATKLLKNFAGDDREGGIVFLLLYQPRKPEHGDLNRPIAAYQIRGDSAVWNELDTCLSPFRAMVETDDTRLTDWGTPATRFSYDGKPKVVKADTPGAKLCDDVVFIKIDKRRIGGEGPTHWLPFVSPCGCVTEYD